MPDYNKVPPQRQSTAPAAAAGRWTDGSHSPHCALKVARLEGARRPSSCAVFARRHALSALGRYFALVLGLLAYGVAQSRAEDLERGKSGPAIFAADCSACHRSAQGLAYGMSPSQLMALLRQHYTTGPVPATQVATYLLSVVGNGRRPKEKPLTEPQPTAGAQGEQSKRRARGEEASTDTAAPRPPGEIGNREPAGPEEAGGERDRAGSAGKQRQQATHSPEPAPANRSRRSGQPGAATGGTEPEPARPPESVPAQPGETVAVRPSEPAATSPPASTEPRPVETPRPVGTKAETASEPAQTAAPAEAPGPAAPRRKQQDQPAFSAPSP
jgi:hypothetical protein